MMIGSKGGCAVACPRRFAVTRFPRYFRPMEKCISFFVQVSRIGAGIYHHRLIPGVYPRDQLFNGTFVDADQLKWHGCLTGDRKTGGLR